MERSQEKEKLEPHPRAKSDRGLLQSMRACPCQDGESGTICDWLSLQGYCDSLWHADDESEISTASSPWCHARRSWA